MARSIFGSSASAIAGGKSCGRRADCVPPNETIRGAVFPAIIALGSVGLPAATRKGSCGAIVRVACGMTVLPKRSLVGFSTGGADFLAMVGGALSDAKNRKQTFFIKTNKKRT